MSDIAEATDIPIYKLVNRQWKVLPNKGDEDIAIKDPKLKQGYLGDLFKKTVIELEEIIKRNESVLNNKSLLGKLKDKGKSLHARQLEIIKALEDAKERDKHQKKVAVPNHNDVHGFEWTGSLTNNTQEHNRGRVNQDLREEDDDNLDPLELMAHHSSCIDPRQTEASRLAEEDPASAIAKELEQMEVDDASREKNSRNPMHFWETRNEMIQQKYEKNGPPKVPFKPFRPINNPKPVPGIYVKLKPVPNKPVIAISLDESQKIEKKYFEKQKERELRLTIEGLVRPNKISKISPLPSTVGGYRDTNQTKHILDSEEDEDDDVQDNFDEEENVDY